MAVGGGSPGQRPVPWASVLLRPSVASTVPGSCIATSTLAMCSSGCRMLSHSLWTLGGRARSGLPILRRPWARACTTRSVQALVGSARHPTTWSLWVGCCFSACWAACLGRSVTRASRHSRRRRGKRGVKASLWQRSSSSGIRASLAQSSSTVQGSWVSTSSSAKPPALTLLQWWTTASWCTLSVAVYGKVHSQTRGSPS
mmetsp:Transcript_55191/g.128448  ORF Transcript_55191/g.128448 Transcript_55191/m.128448 type:complete len:200 (+) Transcript_55191:268-867(+)